ncbi:MAG: PIG-L family deacetylase [Candidatus Saccharicenans sp.]
MNVLIVVAHPDDEVLGAGGTSQALIEQGCKVTACIMSYRADARNNRPDEKELYANMIEAQNTLGFENPILGEFPNIKFNTIPHLELVKFIENAILRTQAELILTHHPSDINNDHHHTSIACQAAARLFQRTDKVLPLKGLYFMEVLSSTDWAFPGQNTLFQPDTFVEIRDFLEKKIKAIKAYKGVLREFPHSRSEEVIRALAAYRGGQSGLNNAEAFQTAFRIGIL